MNRIKWFAAVMVIGCVTAVWSGALAQPAATGPAAIQPARGTVSDLLPATGPAESQPATASKPVTPKINWLDFAAGIQDAKKRNVLLVVVYVDPTAPACEAMEDQVFAMSATARFLADFAAVKVDVVRTPPMEGGDFPKPDDTPWTMVYSPAGQFLDKIVGYVAPADKWIARVQRSADYWKAASVTPMTPAAKWAAVQGRLLLSTADQAAPDLEEMTKDAAKRPADVSAAQAHLKLGLAWERIAPPNAAENFAKARELADKDKDEATAATALLCLAREAGSATGHAPDNAKALGYLAQLVKAYPKWPEIASVYKYKATLEAGALDDRASAIATLKEFIAKYPDDPAVKGINDMLTTLKGPATTRATTRGAK